MDEDVARGHRWPRVQGEHDARVRVYRLRPEPFVTLRERLDQVQAFWTDQLDAFKTHAELRTRQGEHP